MTPYVVLLQMLKEKRERGGDQGGKEKEER